MYLFREPAVRDYAAAARAIPVIDYGPYFAGEKSAPERLTTELTQPRENIGFFYGGDFFAAQRSEWDPETLLEGRYDLAKNIRLLEEANRRPAAT
jgi:hypothetical protein